ncbi:hypothetical protein C5748_11470 [Phyllobacterium phragmitis]|uniref:DUF1127 domain-containing protein n=1 Tax=Phyllobacterium phragmitis TaxID=2670329 RepID=A0A2S9IS31_9HYPH|nr:hypothetical protein [Phyllobacterium phragmitis]PRD43326.1 hypothetical protein C5748_11470 [Phyllobacterium phragmitis]
MDKRKRRGNAPLPERMKALWVFLREEAERRRALGDILAKHGDHWLDDVGISRDEALRVLKRSLLRRIIEWARTDGR